MRLTRPTHHTFCRLIALFGAITLALAPHIAIGERDVGSRPMTIRIRVLQSAWVPVDVTGTAQELITESLNRAGFNTVPASSDSYDASLEVDLTGTVLEGSYYKTPMAISGDTETRFSGAAIRGKLRLIASKVGSSVLTGRIDRPKSITPGGFSTPKDAPFIRAVIESNLLSALGEAIRVVFGSATATIYWQSNPTLSARSHSGTVYSVALTPDGGTVASAGADKAIKLWRSTDGSLLRTLSDHNAPVYALAVSPDGKLLASGGDDYAVRLWRFSDGLLLMTLRSHTGPVRALAFGPDGKVLASAGDDRTIKLWRLPAGKLQGTLSGHTDVVRALTFGVEGEVLGSGSDEGTINLWWPLQGSLLKTLQTPSWVNSLAVDQNGKILISGHKDGTIQLRQLPDGTLLKTLVAHTSWVRALAVPHEQSFLSIGGDDQQVKLWGLPEGLPLRAFTGHRAMKAVAINPTGETLVSGSADRTVRLWDLPRGTPTTVLIDWKD
jgi:WD40 repeat protein